MEYGSCLRCYAVFEASLRGLKDFNYVIILKKIYSFFVYMVTSQVKCDISLVGWFGFMVYEPV